MPDEPLAALDIGLRQVPPPSPDDPSDPELVALLRAEIAARGPMTFERFMDRALYEPDVGYYRRAAAGPGRGGDFLTAPETHPLFGAAIGRLVEEVWTAVGRPDPFVVREVGGGTGALAVTLLDGLRRDGSALVDVVRYEPVEVEPRRLETLRTRLAAEGFAGLVTDAGRRLGDCPGIVLANEVLDALPVHRVVMRDGLLRELVVSDVDGRFAEVPAEPSTPLLAARLTDEDVRLEDGQVTEICLRLDRWIPDAVGGLAPAVLVVIDYGHDAHELYGARRRAGTLRTYATHTTGDDPFVRIGRQDITAHVDFTAVRAAAARAGLEFVAETTQAELLGATRVVEDAAAALRAPGATIEDGLLLRAALARLLDPRATGAFHVLVFASGVDGATVARLRAIHSVARLAGEPLPGE